ncbi:hypothetical protein TNCV_164621 [Trichonephila clavipes]|nr:hypothetical protein TNCV_164621 [Trichonephila clavipes]
MALDQGSATYGTRATWGTWHNSQSVTLHYSTNVSIFERMEVDKFVMDLIGQTSPELWVKLTVFSRTAFRHALFHRLSHEGLEERDVRVSHQGTRDAEDAVLERHPRLAFMGVADQGGPGEQEY